MNIHAISYYNIGPFEGGPLTLCFHDGTLLIKAPIGTGKSFLFFDGPLYALYKYSSRPMINVNHKQGSIGLIFSLEGELYYVKRSLTPSSKKDSCKSLLYKLSALPTMPNGIIHHGQDLYQWITQQQIDLEEIAFKNETDLQKSLDDLLPPREVFLSTLILFQDVTNVFEMTPTDTIEVFKSVFGLMGIDHVKDDIADYKRQLTAKVKALSDYTLIDKQLKQLVLQLKNLGQNHPSIVSDFFSLCGELFYAAEKLTIDGFFHQFDRTVLHNAIEKISAQKKEFLKLHGTYQTLKQSLDQAMQQSIRSQQEIDQLKKHIAELQTHLVEDYTDRLQTLQDQKNHLQQQKTNFDQQDFQQFDQLITCYPDVYEKPDKWTFADAYHCLNAFRSYGTTLKERYDRLEQERQHLQKRLDEFSTNLNQYEFSDGTQAWKLLEVEAQKLIKEYRDRLAMIIQQRNFDINQIDDIVHQRQQLAIKKQILCEHLDQASVFHCEKIEGDCPFIKVINAKTIARYQQEVDQLILDDQQYDQRYQHLSDQLVHKQYDTIIADLTQRIERLEALSLDNYHQYEDLLSDVFITIKQKKSDLIEQRDQFQRDFSLHILDHQIKELDQQIQTLRQQFTSIGYQQLKQDYQNYQEIIKDLEQKNKEYEQLYAHHQQREHYRQQKAQQDILLQEKQHQFEQQQQQIIQQRQAIETLSSQIDEEKLTQYDSQLGYIQQIEKVIDQIERLVADHKEKNTMVQALIVKEKMLGELHTIFAKELMLIVLEDSLPVLCQIINSFLAQVVSYELGYELIKTAGDKLELKFYVNDEKGKRYVTTLSGGQKVVLKISWILAISSYMKSEFLFLDETINNLDAETVGRVADLFNNFVKKNVKKLYIVTHSQQIQDMDIWSDIVDLAQLKKHQQG